MSTGIQKTASRTYSYTNSTGANVTFQLAKLADNSTTFTNQGTAQTVANTGTYDFTLSTDGVYRITLAGTSTTQCIIHEFQASIDAFQAIVTAINCNCSCKKNEDFLRPIVYYSNAIMSNFFALMNIVNTHEVNIATFTTLTTSQLQELFTANKIISKIAELYNCINGTYVNLSSNECNNCT